MRRMKWITARNTHAKLLFGRWWLIVSGLWSMLMIADTLIPKYGSSETIKYWDKLWVLAALDWKMWVIGLLVIALVSVFENSYRRSVSKITIDRLKIYPTPTTDQRERRIFIQILPKCTTPIEKCLGQLLRVLKWNGATWIDTPLEEPLSLVWSFHDASELTLRPEVDQWLNVCMVDSVMRELIPQAPVIPIRASEVFPGGGRFRFHICVAGKDCPGKLVYVDIETTATWDAPNVSLHQV